ncbi:Piso0_005486 [Millerozyma farinosa CBS 7064]|uniref:Piso0_005486 protein n=1 Tax=Pichia sorbitophila (strain ATCC MYA-4447 / BCRC 22081 / CBS 7064 / NBRC 10061 / NRRL Y-12695) TaxID=559304 RepID=G8XZ52_PICSO|nr:Piso0_005486 [Millerozyma farinosa CBS 7064]
MIRHGWRSRWVSRRIRMPSSTQMLSVGVRCMRNDNDFKDNNSMSQTNENKSMATIIKDFIKNEASMLGHNILRKEELIRSSDEVYLDEAFEIEFVGLDQEIKDKLEKAAGPFNKLILCLSFHPTRMTPLMYSYYYEQTGEDIDEETRLLLLRRLVFHREYEQFWKIALGVEPSISELEEISDVLMNELQHTSSTYIGLVDSLLCLEKSVSNRTIFLTILDNLTYNHGVDRNYVLSILDELSSSSSNKNPVHYEIPRSNPNDLKHQVLYIYDLRKKIELDINNKSQLQSLIDNIIQDPSLPKGLLSQILPISKLSTFNTDEQILNYRRARDKESRILDFLLNSTYLKDFSLEVTNCDACWILSWAKPSQADLIYTLFDHKIDYSSYPDSRYLVNKLAYLLLEHESNENLKDLVIKNYLLIDSKYLYLALKATFYSSEAQFSELMKTVESHPIIFQESAFFDDFINDIIKDPTVQANHRFILNIVKTTSNSDITSSIAAIILRQIKYTELEKRLPGEFYKELLESQLSSYITIEAARSILLRRKLYDDDLLCLLIDKVFERSWNKSKLVLEGKLDQSQVGLHDFPGLLRMSPAESRAKFHNRIRAFGQCISLLDSDRISSILNTFSRYVDSPSFTFVTSDKGRKYVKDRLVDETMRFISKSSKHDVRLGLTKMKDVISKLQCNSGRSQLRLYMQLVKNDPQKSIELLHNYKDRKSYLTNEIIRGISSGILLTTKLDQKERLVLFIRFRNEMGVLGYKNKVGKSTAIELLNLVSALAEHERMDFEHLFDFVSRYTESKHIPAYIRRKFADRLRAARDKSKGL